MIPDGLPDVDWIPIDAIVKIIEELIDADSKGTEAKTYNLVNRNTVPWDSISGTLSEYCGHDSKVVPLRTWLEALEQTDMDTLNQEELALKPALKVLPFTREMMNAKMALRYSTARGTQVSRSLRELKQVNQTWLQIWLQRWMATT